MSGHVIRVGTIGHAGVSVALMAAVAGACAMPIHCREVPPDPRNLNLNHRPYKPTKWRTSRPGKPTPHLAANGTVRVKGFKSRGMASLPVSKKGCNFKGSKYEKETKA